MILNWVKWNESSIIGSSSMCILLSTVFYFLNLGINDDPLSGNPTKWSNTLKQIVGNFLTNCLSVFDHFVGLALKGLKFQKKYSFSKLMLKFIAYVTRKYR